MARRSGKLTNYYIKHFNRHLVNLYESGTSVLLDFIDSLQTCQPIKQNRSEIFVYDLCINLLVLMLLDYLDYRNCKIDCIECTRTFECHSGLSQRTDIFLVQSGLNLVLYMASPFSDVILAFFGLGRTSSQSDKILFSLIFSIPLMRDFLCWSYKCPNWTKWQTS